MNLKSEIMQIVLLCGGYGTRMRPYTEYLPKPLILINGKPFLSYLLKQIMTFNPREILLLAGYKSHMIKDYISYNWGDFDNIHVSSTDPNLATADRLRANIHSLDKIFILGVK